MNFSLLFVAALFEDQPTLVDVSSNRTAKQILPTAPRRTEEERENATEKQQAQDAKLMTTVATFSKSGNHIIAGTNRGWLNIIDTGTFQTLASVRLTNSIIILLRLTSSGRDMVVNSSDKIIRTVRMPDLDDTEFDFDKFGFENEHKYQDMINNLSWNHVGISSTGEYVVASIYMNFSLYVWETGHSSLEKILEGPKEELSAVEVRHGKHRCRAQID